jgi:hypothetical protein
MQELPSLEKLAEARNEVKKQFRRGRLFGEFKEHPLEPFLRAGLVTPVEGQQVVDNLETLHARMPKNEVQRITELAAKTLPK